MFSNSHSKMSESQIKFLRTSVISHLRWKWHEIESFPQKNEAKVTLCSQKWGESDTIWGESDTLPSKMRRKWHYLRRKWHDLRRLEAKLKLLDLPIFKQLEKWEIIHPIDSGDEHKEKTMSDSCSNFIAWLLFSWIIHFLFCISFISKQALFPRLMDITPLNNNSNPIAFTIKKIHQKLSINLN